MNRRQYLRSQRDAFLLMMTGCLAACADDPTCPSGYTLVARRCVPVASTADGGRDGGIDTMSDGGVAMDATPADAEVEDVADSMNPDQGLDASMSAVDGAPVGTDATGIDADGLGDTGVADAADSAIPSDGEMDTAVADLGTAAEAGLDLGSPDGSAAECTSDVPCGGGMVNFPPAICTRGVRRCVGGRLDAVCAGSIEPEMEICNAVDDDCDGLVNEEPDARLSCGAPSADVACETGMCVITGCLDGRVDCNRQIADGCEADLTSSILNCGRCGSACDAGEPCVGGICDPVVGIAAGDRHTCVVRHSGFVDCWGENMGGAIGDGTSIDRALPTRVGGVTAAIQVAAGVDKTCVVRGDRRVYCWGNVAIASTDDPSTIYRGPVEVTAAGFVAQVAVGLHVCVRLDSGAVRCWGENEFGQCGDDSPMDFRPPVVAAVGVATAVGIALGSQHTCAPLSAGQWQCWGNNEGGQLGGDPASFDRSTIPISIVATDPSQQPALGRVHTCSRWPTGAVYCWGGNSFGQLGTTDPVLFSPMAYRVTGIPDAVDLSAGWYHTCARRSLDDRVACWGSNSHGQLGDVLAGGATSSATPVLVNGLRDARFLAAGRQHTCAVVADGRVLCWGDNAAGQLGNGTMMSSTTPVQALIP